MFLNIKDNHLHETKFKKYIFRMVFVLKEGW